VGVYPITFSSESLTASNYTFTYVSGTLGIYSGPPLLLSPAGATAGGAGFTLTVTGADFTTASVVLWNGAVRTTTYVSSTQLTAAISDSDIANEATNLITVANCTPPLSTSSALPFVVMSAAPVAAISAASLAVAADSSGNHILSLTGTDFVSGSVIEWNGINLTTTYVGPWQLSAVVPASDYASLSTSLPTPLQVGNPSGTSPEFITSQVFILY
jgi:hypothetical protein